MQKVGHSMWQVAQSPEHVESEGIYQPATVSDPGVDSGLNKPAVKNIFESVGGIKTWTDH